MFRMECDKSIFWSVIVPIIIGILESKFKIKFGEIPILEMRVENPLPVFLLIPDCAKLLVCYLFAYL